MTQIPIQDKQPTFEEARAALHEAWARENPNHDLLLVFESVSKELMMDESAKDFLMTIVPDNVRESARKACARRLGINLD